MSPVNNKRNSNINFATTEILMNHQRKNEYPHGLANSILSRCFMFILNMCLIKVLRNICAVYEDP